MRAPVLVAFIACLAAQSARAGDAKPRLGVLVVFDQMSAREIDRYTPFFGAGGFGGIDGARFDALYQYADTETGPGHATLATGANPTVHGIGTNVWFVGAEKHYVVDDKAFPVIGGEGGRGPSALMVPTLGDTMKADSDGKAKVVTVSLKDRAAILTGGRSADIAIWYDVAQGRFTTSTAYADKLPPWLEDKGAAIPQKSMATATWSPLPIPAGLEYLVPVDARPGEGGHDGMSPVFPHDLSTQPDALKKKLYRLAPQAIDDVFSLALTAVDEVGLGKDDEADLLVVSISTTDFIGHNYGPDSLEQLDMLRRADLSLRRFIEGLTTRLTRRGFVLAVTSDHGVPPLPLPAESAKWPHGILLESDVVDAATKAAASALPKDKKARVLGFLAPQIGLDTAGLSPTDADRLTDAVMAAVEAIPGVARVYDLARPGDVDAFEPFMRASYVPGRQAPLFVRPAPRVVFMENKEKTGTDHGTPYVYDRRVPLFLMGPGVRGGRYAQPVDPRDVSATLAFLLRVAPPDACQGKPVVAVGEP